MLSDDEVAIELAGQAKEKRLDLNITQKDFAKQVGMSHLSYVEFESSGKTSSIKLIKILRRLQILGDMMMAVVNRNSLDNLGVEEYYKKSISVKRMRARK
jgi:transcriptional regulator with XRE-family HTH domain